MLRQVDLAQGKKETWFLALYGAALGISVGGSFALGYDRVIAGELESGDVVTAFFAFVIGGVAFIEITPAIGNIAAGRLASAFSGGLCFLFVCLFVCWGGDTRLELCAFDSANPYGWMINLRQVSHLHNKLSPFFLES
jgi:hypothetical protein